MRSEVKNLSMREFPIVYMPVIDQVIFIVNIAIRQIGEPVATSSGRE